MNIKTSGIILLSTVSLSIVAPSLAPLVLASEKTPTKTNLAISETIFSTSNEEVTATYILTPFAKGALYECRNH